MTVPAKPQSMGTGESSSSDMESSIGLMVSMSGEEESILAPSARMAWIMRSLSRDWSTLDSRLGPVLMAARMSERFINDLDPGTDKEPSRGLVAAGACHVFGSTP